MENIWNQVKKNQNFRTRNYDEIGPADEPDGGGGVAARFKEGDARSSAGFKGSISDVIIPLLQFENNQHRGRGLWK